MKRKVLSLFLAIVLCAGLLPVTAWAAEPGEHTDHTGWTTLTPDYLTANNYTLGDGKYFIDGQLDGEGWPPEKEFDQQIMIEGDVTLCLYNTRYVYTGSEEAALLISENATLTYCNCTGDEYGNFNGSLYSMGGKYVIENRGMLHVSGGDISIYTEGSSAVNNMGTLSITGGNIHGGPLYTVDWDQNEHVPGFGIYNHNDCTVSLGGAPRIDGTSIASPEGPSQGSKSANGISTANAISAVAGTTAFSGESSVTIHYRGEPGIVVTGVSGDPEDYGANWRRFNLSYPENAELIYDKDAGTLTFPGYSSLRYCGAIVYGGKYYKVEPQTEDYTGEGLQYVYQTSILTEGTEDDYDIYWDEESKTLALNTLSCEVDADAISEALFSTNCDTLNIHLVGENSVALGSSKNLGEGKTSVFENRGGSIVVNSAPEAKLTVEMPLGDGNGTVATMTAFKASGSFENNAALTITSTNNSDTRACREMIGISSGGFSNNGTLTINLKEANNTYNIQCNGDFNNTGIMDLDAASNYEAYGIDITDGNMNNTDTITLDLVSEYTGSGISSGTFAGNWSNSGDITIHVTGNQVPGRGVGAASAYNYIAGVDIWSDGALSFTNSGTLDVTAHKKPDENNINDTNTNFRDTKWPVDVYFDTIGILLVPRVSPSFILNSGAMTSRGENGYSAALNVYIPKDRMEIINEGTMDMIATTTGGENVHAAGIFSMMQGGEDGAAKKLSLDLRDGSILTATAGPVDGVAAPEAVAVNCHAVSLIQYFYDTVLGSATDFQQILLEEQLYVAQGGEQLVLGPIHAEDEYTSYDSYINTIGSGDVPAQTVQVKPKTTLTGSIAIDGKLQTGSSLTAKTENVPDNALLTFQWQICDTLDGTFTDIPEATGQTYILTTDEIGKYIRVIAVPSDPQYSGTLMATTADTVSRKPSGGGGITYYTVKFDTDGGSAVETQRIGRNGKATKPADPEKEGFTFAGWYTDTERTTEYDFNKTVTASLTLYAKWTEITEPNQPPAGPDGWNNPFTDVTASDWFYGNVRYVYENNLFKGMSEQLFGPNVPMTRAMFVTVLWRIEGEPEAGRSSFDDVPADAYYAKAAAWAAAKGIVKGYDDRTFAPNDLISREQLAAMLYRYARYKGYDVSAGEKTNLVSYRDAGQIGEWAILAVQWAVGDGIINGRTEDTIAPQGSATRAEVAAMLHRFLEKVNTKDE